MSIMNNTEFGLTEEQKMIRKNVLPMLAKVMPSQKIPLRGLSGPGGWRLVGASL
jgi:hypothetical protein